MLDREREYRDSYCDIGHGAFQSQRTFLGRVAGWTPWSECPTCVEEEHQAEERARRERDRQERIERMLERANIPEKHRQAGFDNYRVSTEEQRQALRTIREWEQDWPQAFQRGRSLVFFGGVGTGKTHLAIACLRAISGRGVQGAYVTFREYLREIRDTWRDGSSRSEAQVRAWYGSRVKLLVVDEIGVQRGTEDELVEVTELVDQRYRNCLPTILVTNCDSEGVKRYLGERALSRLREGGGRSIPFTWDDYRKGVA